MFLDAKQNWVITNHHYNVVKRDIYKFNIYLYYLIFGKYTSTYFMVPQ